MIETLLGLRLYLDANVVIYAVEAFPRYALLCQLILEAIENGRIEAVSSELTLAEVLVDPIRRARLDGVARYEGVLRANGKIQMRPVTRSILRGAAEIRAGSGCKLSDAIHCATALDAGCQLLLTADRRMRPPSGLRIVLLDDLLPPPPPPSP